MKIKIRKRYLLFLLATAVLLAIITAITTYPATLTNKVVIDGTEYVVNPDTKISIRLEYEHSVELTKITEEYEARGCEIKLVRFVWAGYGAGLSSTPNDTLSQTIDGSGNYVTGNITLSTTTLKISMKHRVNPKLMVNGEEAKSAEEVIIMVCSKTTLIELLIAPKLPWPNKTLLKN